MSVEKLLARLDVLLAAKGLSDRKACLKAREINPAVGVDFLRDMRRRGHPPRADKLSALAQVLDVDAKDLLSLVTPEAAPVLVPAQMGDVPVVGIVQAGHWAYSYASEVPEEYLAVPPDHRYPSIQRSAFRVVGDSMDLLYPDGTVVIVVSPHDFGRGPKNGEKVIVVRTRDGMEEATLKEVELREDGRVVLWPRSSNPEFSQAIVLPDLQQLLEYADDGGHPPYRITGIVIQSIRPE